MKTLTTKQFISALNSGTNALFNNVDKINLLNVFPVPDGDTGSNMYFTADYGNKVIGEVKSGASIGTAAAVFSKGVLLGARGNSGVIFSQIFKGISLSLKGVQSATPENLLAAWKSGTKLAYESLIEPVEGTILTVMREMTEKLSSNFNPAMLVTEFFKQSIDFAHESLLNTPNLLPILKEVGVVDSGGQGLVVFLEGMYEALIGKGVIQQTESNIDRSKFIMKKEVFQGEFGFCTEFIIILEDKEHFSKDRLLKDLKKIETSSEVVVVDDDILKIHCHTMTPLKILNYANKLGDFFKIKIDNMNEQASQNVANPSSNKVVKSKPIKTAVITCNNGEGIIKDMKDYGVNFVIEGGQTMNPSAGDFVKAINSLEVKEIIILPNNSNIFLAAQQAAKTAKKKKVIVLPTKTQMDGLVAMIHYNFETSLKENVAEMSEAIKNLENGAITKATKTVRVNWVKVKKDDYIAIGNHKIILSHESRIHAAKHLIKKLVKKNSEIATIYVGQDATISDGKEIASYAELEFGIETEVKNGYQANYDFLIGIE